MTSTPDQPSQQTNARSFGVVVMSGAPPRVLMRLLKEIHRQCNGCRVTGVLYWVPAGKNLKQRVRNFVSQLGRPGYPAYVCRRIGQSVRAVINTAGHKVWQFVHASFKETGPSDFDRLTEFCREQDIPFRTTDQFHSESSLQFVAARQPQLGIVYGTPILKPQLFEIPTHGSVNLHQRKVPDYRGGGPIGLWELLNGENEIGVTVHRVAAKLDAGSVIHSSTIPIEPLDTLASLEAKAHVAGIDLLTRTVRDFANNTVREKPQQGEGRMFRNPKPEALPKLLKQLQQLRPRPAVENTYPTWKLAARFALLTPWLAVRNWYRKVTRSFPLVVLYHHVITDRPHFMGMSTDQFISQLDYLHRYFDVVDLETGLRRLHSGGLTRPTVVLTFDDGYRDNVLNLRAAALCHDVPALLYVCSQHLEHGNLFAHDVERGHPDFEPMSWDEAQTLQAWGFSFGAHTRTHFDCGSEDKARLLREIRDSGDEIAERMNTPVRNFSFPFGLQHNISGYAYDVATAHYSTVASAYGGTNRMSDTAKGHVFRLPHPSSIAELELLLQSILIFKEPDLWTGPSPSQHRPEETSQPAAETVGT